MDEPVSLVLDFLRQHNFGKAEEALRVELQARHCFASPTSSYDKGDVRFSAHKDCLGNAVSLVDRTAFKISQQKPEFSSLNRNGIIDNHYAEWEFSSSSNNDCVLEFRKQDARLRRTMELPSNNHHEVRQNGAKPMNHVLEGMGLGRRTHTNADTFCCFENTVDDELALTQRQQHESELACDTKPRRSRQLQRDLGAFEPEKCSCMDEPKLATQKCAHEVKALSPQSNGQKFASSAYHSFSDTSWLDFGVWDDDALKASKFTQPSLHPLPSSEELDQLEEKRVVHDCIDYIKALALEDHSYSPDLFNYLPLPWEIGLQKHLVEEEYLNERITQDCNNLPSSNLRSLSGSSSITNGFTDSFGLDKLHTNALFEPAFNLGSYLDIPVGQGTTSPGEKYENGVCHHSYSENAMPDTSELLYGFATLGDEPTDAGMGYCKEYWGSDMYEDDEDPGYEREVIEDEDWFLAHEITDVNENGEGQMIKKTVLEDFLSHSNKRSEMRQGKEDSFFHTREPLDTAVSDGSQAKLGPHIASVTTFFGHSSAVDSLTLNEFGTMSYDGYLMDAEELKFMGAEHVWQGCSSQLNKHVHDGTADEGEAYEIFCGDCLRQISEEAIEDRKCERVDVNETNKESGDGSDQLMYRDDNWGTCGAESIRNVDGNQIPSKLDLMSAAVKEASENSHVSNIGDAFFCSAPLDVKGMKCCKHVSAGCGSNSTVSNQGMNAVNSDARCLPLSLGSVFSSQEGHLEVSKTKGSAALWRQESDELSPVSAVENRTSLSPALFSHPNALNHVSFPSEICEARDEETAVYTYDSAVNEPAVDDGETSIAQEEAQLVNTEEYEYEVFNLRIIHRKNRTGFEEEKHFQVELNSVVAGRYLITEYLGSAAFSKAVQARDLQTGMDVCMKIIKNNKDFFDQSLDEIKLLKYINKNDPADKHHLLRLYDYFYHKEHLFIVCELLRANLYEFYKFNKESGGEPYFTMSRLQSITQQCLEALEFLHGLGLIHCDLKPENILIKSYSRCEIKVIDLGSSCFQTDHLCSYVQSRSYRAPEVILGHPYDQKIDIWSLGCILAELCSGYVLFQNDSLATLLARVTGIIEPIMPDMILKGKEAHKYFTKNLMLFERNQDTNKLEYLLPKRSSLRHRLPSGDLGFVDFVGYLLQVNPENRPNASEALKHPWLTHPYEPIC
ncbi:hypothetical protein L7F22_024033 [Adiantum nelumboides]|nr:hypothetical protein [Adiantum nelumboides]